MSQIENANSDIRYSQSAVIPFQLKKNRIKILLITSLKTKQWIFPKGIIEEHLTPWVSIEKAINLINKEELQSLLRQFEENKGKIKSAITTWPNVET
jgi:8-oxo-dGTP pyrophosphatase MutT (NUDIX family)